MSTPGSAQSALPTPAPLQPQNLRRCLGRFPTGVTVVAYEIEGAMRGATVNAFSAVSLDPPLVLVSLKRGAKAEEAVRDRPFTVNVLASDQVDVAMQFAGMHRPGANVRWRTSSAPGQARALVGTSATFWCTPWRRYDGGDHVLVLGQVQDADFSAREPLLFSDSRFSMTGLPLFDGPLVHGKEDWPVPAWSGVVRALHRASAD